MVSFSASLSYVLVIFLMHLLRTLAARLHLCLTLDAHKSICTDGNVYVLLDISFHAGLIGVNVKRKLVQNVPKCNQMCSLTQLHRRHPPNWLTYQHLSFLKRQVTCPWLLQTNQIHESFCFCESFGESTQ